MENATNQISYSLKEKYLQVLPEGRIRRYQYFARSLVFVLPLYVVMFFLIWGFIKGIFGFTWILYGSFISSFLFTAWIYFPIKVLIQKRCRDIGRNGKTEVWVFTIATILQLLYTGIIALYVIFSIDLMSGVAMGILGLVYPYLNMINWVVNLVCLLQPGKKWDNEWGKDPVSTKVSFLG